MIKQTSAARGPVVLIRGAGEQATGVAWALSKAGYRVVMTEVAQPLMVRWPVCFGTAIPEKRWEVEGISAERIINPRECQGLWQKGEIPVIVDPELDYIQDFSPAVVVDAILAKRNTGTRREMAGLVIGLGPGFTAGTDVDLVVETNRGHDLGRLIYSGSAEPNTGIPGEIAGYSTQRVLYAGLDGRFSAGINIGEHVKAGEFLGNISGRHCNEDVLAPMDGMLRGLIRTGTLVETGMKIGDIDPRNQKSMCWSISDKARALGTAVLLGILEKKDFM
ncbi:MAG TPA: selenium-dependent molybdenum cofactor biosynthesis protein YqeB [Candidatus Deferrimicrobium sp.]|nr:selenium-dependent molybdenum cofactor biosynthesis protein YqeB [Candidatus Deferrimicrobium sp.]